MPRTLLLDLDGTLVDTVPDLAPALNRLMATRALPGFTAAQVAAMVGDGVPALVAKAFAAHGRTPDAGAVQDFTSDYEAHVAIASRPYPGVIEALDALAGQGWQFAVCTNKPERAAVTLIRTVGLARLIKVIGAGDSFPVRKPDPAHLLATLDRAAGTPGTAVMLGDHRNDVTAASAAGIASIFALWGYGPPSMAAGSAATAQSMTEAAVIANRILPAGH